MTWSQFKIISKIRIVYSVIFTGFIGFVMAHRDVPSLTEAIKLTTILFLSSSAAAMMNNLLDRDIDQKMARTQNREMIIQKIGSKKLWSLAISMAFASFFISFIWFGWIVLTLIVLAIFSYVIWYTLILKRKDPFGTILGGLPGALPIPIGAYTISNREMPDVWLMFLWMMAWQPAHFWALSINKSNEYLKAGIPILPIIRGKKLTHIFIYLYATPLIPITTLIAFAGGYNLIFLIPATLFGLLYLIVTVWSLEVYQKPMVSFFFSLIYLFAIFVAIILDIFLTPLFNFNL